MTAVTGRYSDEPRCTCLHAKVLHRGREHLGKCIAVHFDADDYINLCTCAAFELAVPA